MSYNWEKNAKEVKRLFGAFVDWEERFYNCPYCGEPVYECDWDEEELEMFYCPICEDLDEDFEPEIEEDDFGKFEIEEDWIEEPFGE